MKAVFISNFFNHHQEELSNYLYELLGGNYYFIQTEKMNEERKRLYKMEFSLPKYVIDYSNSEEDQKQARLAIEEADFVVLGSVPDRLEKGIIKTGKLVFRYSERPLKNGLEIAKYPFRFIKWRMDSSKNTYLLCASAYTLADYKKFGLYKQKALKWGYFPKTINYQIDQLIHNKQKASLLWVGRLIDWKHPEMAIFIAEKLKEEGIFFRLNIVGEGELRSKIEGEIAQKGLMSQVKFLGPKTPIEVRKIMEESQIFLFTSDRREGWGAVLNEAMNSGCAVVANKEIGSVPYLIDDKRNGFVYNCEQQLYDIIKELLINEEETLTIGKEAYKKIATIWNAKTAAERLVVIADNIFKLILISPPINQ